MTTTRIATYAAAGGVVLLLLAAAPYAFAHNGEGKHKAGIGAKAEVRLLGDGVRVSGDANTKVRIKADRQGDAEDRRARMEEWRKRWKEYASRVTAGVVTSVNGSVFTIDPAGDKSTTTVTVHANTVIKTKGATTTTASLQQGTRVLVVGTTTATSTTGDSITAAIVKIFAQGWTHLKFWHWFDR